MQHSLPTTAALADHLLDSKNTNLNLSEAIKDDDQASISSENDVLLNDQNARLTLRIIGDCRLQPIVESPNTLARKQFSSPSCQSLIYLSSDQTTDEAKLHNCCVNYRSTTTTTTTTTIRTELSSPPLQKCKITAKSYNCGNLSKPKLKKFDGGQARNHIQFCTPEVISDDDDDEHTIGSYKKPLLFVLGRFNREKITKTTTTTTRSNTGCSDSALESSERLSLLPKTASDVNYQTNKGAKHTNAASCSAMKGTNFISIDSTAKNEMRRGSTTERETWANKTDFLLSVIGFAVDLANVWRFPYLCFKNGGGAFLIPYVIMVALAGIPLFYMELALGQYNRKGAITTWGKICPLFKGIGYCVIMTAFYTDFFYNVIIAFALHYFFASFTTKLPWTSCSNSYNSPACYEPSWTTSGSSQECATAPVFINSSTFNSSHRAVSAAEEYFYKYFLRLHEERTPVAHVAQSVYDLGDVNWELFACVLIVYCICYFSLWKGIKMSGKVVWFTAIFPYVVMGVLLARGVTLPGWEKGIEYYLKPNLEMLKVPSVWQDAATQVFFSLGPGFGVLLAYSSYNDFHNNVYFDALIASSINCVTSFMAGFVIFAILGYMSCKSGKPIHEVAQEGPGLAFVVYPEVLATMPGSWMWSIAFFLMLLTLGLDSSFGGSEAIITGLSDEYPILGRNRELFVGVLFLFYLIVGIFMCTQGGMLVMEWLIFYGTAWGLLIAVFCETMVISFCYGIKQFSNDIREMLGFEPGWYWKICWALGAPTFLIAMIISSFVNYQPLQYQDYVYPFSANVFGLIFALTSASAIPIVGIYTWYHQPGDNCWQKLQMALIPIKRRKSSPLSPNDCSGNDSSEFVPHSNDVML